MLWRLDLKHQSTLDDQEGVKNNVYLRFSVEVSENPYDDIEISKRYKYLKKTF